MPAARHRGCPESRHGPVQGFHDGSDRGVADGVEAGGDTGLGAGQQVCGDGVGVQVGVATAGGRVGVGLLQPGGP